MLKFVRASHKSICTIPWMSSKGKQIDLCEWNMFSQAYKDSVLLTEPVALTELAAQLIEVLERLSAHHVEVRHLYVRHRPS